ncbi:MAG: hypothetical protein ACP5N0_02155 [Methanosarcina sp.]|uniref:hypothetical protein n=1 Tax=Methanosarcina sp. TaxID=2213 RepID=UPI003BB66C02
MVLAYVSGVVWCRIPAALIRFHEASSFKLVKEDSIEIKNPVKLCNKASKTNNQIVNLVS